jgi:hypothetical protein
MFEQILVKKNGAEIKRMAARKKALLQTSRQKVEESSNDIMQSAFLNMQQKEIMIIDNKKMIEEIDGSIIFCEVIVEHIPDEITFDLSIREINFLMNNQEWSYK